jgi:hypothetical protein
MAGLQAGAASVKINPPLGLKKGGFRLFAGPITSIDDDMELQILVLRSKGQGVAIIASDIGNAVPEEATEIRELVAEILNIPRAHVMFNYSHNHSSPTLPANNGNATLPDDYLEQKKYYAYLLEQVAECARSAQNLLRDARIACAWGDAALNVYRREWNNGQDILGEVLDHDVDSSVGVIRVDDLSGKAIATMFRYSCHPVVNGAVSPTLSADFPGPARRLVEEKVGGVGLFLQGCGGNINPKVGIGYEVDCSETVQRVGTALGAEVVKIALGINTHREQKERVTLNGIPNILFKPWSPITEHPDIVLSGSEEVVPFRYSPLPAKEVIVAEEAKWRKEIEDRIARGALSWEIRAARTVHAWTASVVERVEEKDPTCDFMAHALRIGDIVLVGLGVEAFYQTGEQIKANSPWENTFVLGYTNGTIMYLPRAEDFPPGGWKWPNTYALPDLLPQVYCQPALWHPDSEQEAVQAALRALESVRD